MMNGNGAGPHPQPAPVDGRTEVAITLQINNWNVALMLIAEGPWKTADPLIAEIRRQIGVALDAGGERAGHSLQAPAP